jgi:hypothetical protein
MLTNGFANVSVEKSAGITIKAAALFGSSEEEYTHTHT